MDVSLESLQTCLDGPTVHVAKALRPPELELVLSLGFLASLQNQHFQDSPKILHWAEFGDLQMDLLLVAQTGCTACRTRLELEVRSEHLHGLARTEFCFAHTLHQWILEANSWSPRTVMPASSQAPPTRSHDCWRSLLLAETGSLTSFLPLHGFRILSDFSPHTL